MGGAKSRAHIDVSKGMYMGIGINLEDELAVPQPVYIPWNTLNSHQLTYGTTRTGKSRLLAFQMRQMVAVGHDVCLFEPKGSEGQEMVSWLLADAQEFGRLKDVAYFSPYFPEDSERINLLYGMKNAEVSGAVESIIDGDEQFYSDIANEISMSFLLSLEFIQRTYDPLVVEMMREYEYEKALIGRRYRKLNKALQGSNYIASMHDSQSRVKEKYFFHVPDAKRAMRAREKFLEDVGIKSVVTEGIQANLIDPFEAWVRRVEKAWTIVMSHYGDNPPEFPIREFITFRDLALFGDHENLARLSATLERTIEQQKAQRAAAYSRGIYSTGYDEQGNFHIVMSDDDMRIAHEAKREIKKVKNRDPNYFSKVASTYATTMTKLSVDDMGVVLCDSKINILRDRLYMKEQGLLLVVQPFPLKYQNVATMAVKIFMSMFSSIAGHIGASGIMNERRLDILIDEAGSVVTEQVATNLANKGGGLGISLYLFTQSHQDYVKALEKEGAAILADNANTKAVFRVNDNDSAAQMSDMIGTIKKGETSYTSADSRDGRAQGKQAEEALVPPHMIQRLEERVYVLKTGANVYLMNSPWQDDPIITIDMPTEDAKGNAERYNKRESYEFEDFSQSDLVDIAFKR